MPCNGKRYILYLIKKIVHILLFLVASLLAWAQQPVGENFPASKSVETMKGTYYADLFVGRRTKCGDVFRQNQYTAAHRKYKCGTYLLVTNPKNQQHAVVLVNDHCPIANVLDMTKRTLMALGMVGTQKVQVQILDETVGYQLWVQQDTLGVDDSDYLAFRDRSRHHRISPYSSNANPKQSKQSPSKGNPDGWKVHKNSIKSTQQEENTVQDSTIVVFNTDTLVSNSPMFGADTTSVPGFDLELLTVNSMKAAHWESNRLPSDYQQYVYFKENKPQHTITIILRLNQSRSKAVRTQAMLMDLFPESVVIPQTVEREKRK